VVRLNVEQTNKMDKQIKEPEQEEIGELVQEQEQSPISNSQPLQEPEAKEFLELEVGGFKLKLGSSILDVTQLAGLALDVKDKVNDNGGKKKPTCVG